MNKNLVYLSILICLILSCETTEKLSEIQQTQNTLTDDEITSLLTLGSYKVSISEIEEQANQILEEWNSDNSNERSVSTTKIKSILPITKNSTSLRTTEDSINLAYAVNFTDANEAPVGFAIISGDRRIPGIYGISSSGEFEDSKSNPGLNIFLSDIEIYAEEELNSFHSKHDSLVEIAKQKLLDNLPDSIKEAIIINDTIIPNAKTVPYDMKIEISYGSWTDKEKYGRLLPTDWDQREPYNNNIDKYCITELDTTRAPAGCTPIAFAQIMAYHKYPDSRSGVYFDWDYMLTVGDRATRTISANDLTIRAQHVAHLVERIGRTLATSYECDGSTTFAPLAVGTTWEKWGYEYVDNRITHNKSDVISEMKAGRPILIEGAATKVDVLGVTLWYKDYHSWVIDGYRVQQRPRYTTITYLNSSGTIVGSYVTITYEEQTFYHNNFGWGHYDAITYEGNNNGWYKSGVFDTRGDYSPDIISNNRISGKNYQYQLKITTGIKPAIL